MNRVILLLVSFLIFGCTTQASKPKNIIVMIGDGMGVSQVTAGHTVKGGLELRQFKHLGLVLTHAYGDYYITDSAAGATALSTGVKTFNGAIAVGPDSLRRETILQRAQKKGMKTGLVVVSSITHATPAAFVAHVPSRTLQIEIAEYVAESRVDVVLGGGWGWFLPKNNGGRRTDGKDLVRRMVDDGYRYVSTDDAFHEAVKGRPTRLLGLFAENHLSRAETRKPTLTEMTVAALELLSRNTKGFFLMVEGSQIDWGGHENNTEYIAGEMIDFDDAVGSVLRFLERHPETLVVVTADHETGGFALNDGSLRERRVSGAFTTDYHTGAMVPLFAMGPAAERFTGIRDIDEIGRILLELLE